MTPRPDRLLTITHRPSKISQMLTRERQAHGDDGITRRFQHITQAARLALAQPVTWKQPRTP
jgi:hypothetical protein